MAGHAEVKVPPRTADDREVSYQYRPTTKRANAVAHPTTRATRGAALILTVATAALSGLGLVAHPAVAAESTNYGIRPAKSADHFRMELAPGAAGRQTAIVSNRSSKKVTFKVYAADALTTAQGGFALRSRDEPQSTIGTWAQLPLDSVTINARSQRNVSFRLTVPAATTPGDYAGGIILEAPPRQGTPGEIGDQTAVQLNVVERVGVRIYLKVSGTARAGLSAGPLRVDQQDSAIAFTMPVTNTGNVILAPGVTATVRGRVGGNKKLTFTRVDELLPGQSVTVRATWRRPPSLIWARADAAVEHAGGTELVQAEVRRVPVIPVAIITVLVLLALGVGVRSVRTVQQARRVLRQAPTALEPVPSATWSTVTAPETTPPEPVGQSRGRHRYRPPAPDDAQVGNG